jgi:hypothetical protein
MWRDDVRFLPYWEHGLGVEPVTAGVDVSAHVRPGNAVLWVVNENREDTRAVIKLDTGKLGLDPGRPVVAYDAENRAQYTVANGSLTVAVPKRMWRAVRLFQPRQLAGELAFVASFDKEPAADEAYGGRYPLGDELPTLAPGKEGLGLPIDRPVMFPLRQHVGTEGGVIRLFFRAVEHSTGTLMSLGGLDLGLANGRITLSASGKAVAPVGPVTAGPGWDELALSWQGHELQVAYNGANVFTAPLAPLPFVGCGRGFEIRDPSRHIEPSAVRFGPLRGAVIDDLRMALKP